MCPLTKSAFGSPTHADLSPRLERIQNLVSTNVPEVIESFRASCNRIGMAMIEVVMSEMPEMFEVRGEFKAYTWLRCGRLS